MNEGETGYIAAKKSVARTSRSLKHDDTFAVIDSHGDLNAISDGSDGLYYCDTRHLSYVELRVADNEPLLLGSTLSDDGVCVDVDLSNPDIQRDGEIILFKDQVHLKRTSFVFEATLRQKVTATNYGIGPVAVHLTIGFDADFADLFEVRGMSRTERGVLERNVDGPSAVTFAYRGLDHLDRSTRITFHPPPMTLQTTVATYKLLLDPRDSVSVFIEAACASSAPPQSALQFATSLKRARRMVRTRVCQRAEVLTGHAVFNEVMRRSSTDLAMLTTKTPWGQYPYAGVPWFSTAFGRDALITAIEMLWLDPDLARDVLRYLAHHQAHTTDPTSDAEPGKILHEVRHGEMAVRGEVPFGKYYGSVDATPLFVLLAGLYAERTADDAFLTEIWPNIEAALQWMDGPGDPDGDGFIEYAGRAERGLVNQGWKDSGDAVFHADGTLATGPIALVEVQAYAFEAKKRAAFAARRLGKKDLALDLERAAEKVQERFESAFWCSRRGTYALALDGRKRQCEVLTSNAGQVLRSGIAADWRNDQLSDLLLNPIFYSGWGIRTVAKGEARYNPMSYHNGSVWPHDTALIAAGLARIGRREAAEQILMALADAARAMDQRRLPELFCGFRRGSTRHPVLYPVACSPQAWASGAIFYVLQSILGLEIDGTRPRIRLKDARVPKWLDFIELLRLPVGRSLLDLRLRRSSNGKTELEAKSKGPEVVVECS
jgi:glycogen debranching enzyme